MTLSLCVLCNLYYRKSAHRIMQSRQQQWHSGYTGSDAESLRSNDSSVGHPNTHDRENSTGSSRTESSRTESSRTESEVNVGDNDNRPPTPDRKHKPGKHTIMTMTIKFNLFKH